jgi:hypothetical protein
VLRHSLVAGLERVHGHAARADEGLDQQGMGDDDARIGGQRRGALEGVEALSDDGGVADVVRPGEVAMG